MAHLSRLRKPSRCVAWLQLPSLPHPTHDDRMVGPVEQAVRSSISEGAELPTPTGRARFIVERLDTRGVTLLFGPKRTPTTFSWPCLEGLVGYIKGQGLDACRCQPRCQWQCRHARLVPEAARVSSDRELRCGSAGPRRGAVFAHGESRACPTFPRVEQPRLRALRGDVRDRSVHQTEPHQVAGLSAFRVNDAE